MWKAISGILAGLLLSSLLLAWGERSARIEAVAKLESMELALNSAKSDALQAALEVNRLSGAEKERRYVALAEAGSDAAVSIATAQAEPGGIDPGDLLPLSLTEFRHGLRESICAGGACGYAGPGQLRAPGTPQAQGQAGRTDNGPAGGGRD